MRGEPADKGHSLAVLRRSEFGEQWIEMYTMIVEPIEYGWRPWAHGLLIAMDSDHAPATRGVLFSRRSWLRTCVSRETDSVSAADVCEVACYADRDD